MGRPGGRRRRRPSPANLTSASMGKRGRKRRRSPPPPNSLMSIGEPPPDPPPNPSCCHPIHRDQSLLTASIPATPNFVRIMLEDQGLVTDILLQDHIYQIQAEKLGPFGVIMVLFETPSGFGIFYFDGISLYEPDAMENIWENFVRKSRADSVLWRKKFRVFKDKSDAINLDTGLNNHLTKMLLKWHLPGQKLAVGKPEYKTVIEARLGIPCLCDEPVMELMRGLKYLMHSIVPEEKSTLAENDGLETSQGLKMLLSRYGLDVKPEMVNQCIIEEACILYDCDSSLKNNTKRWRRSSAFLEEVSSINSKDWEVLKLATALKIVCYPEDEIVLGNPQKMFTPNELSKLVTDAPKYDDSGIIKGDILGRYNEMVSFYDSKSQHRKELASLIRKAKEAYEAEQTRN